MNEDHAKLTGQSQLEIVRILPAPCERVWQYLVDPDLRQKWFCSGKTGSAPGEPFVMDFDHRRISETPPPSDMGCGDAVVMEGTITEFEPPHKLAYRWPGATPEEDTVVTILLAEEGNKTRLHLIHSQLENPDFQQGASIGWHAHLDLLLDLCSGINARDFWVHYSNLKEVYDSKSSIR